MADAKAIGIYYLCVSHIGNRTIFNQNTFMCFLANQNKIKILLPMTWYTNAKEDTNQIGNQAGGYQPHHPIKAVR